MNTYNTKTTEQANCSCGARYKIESVDLTESEIMNIVRGRILSSSFECTKCELPVAYTLIESSVDLTGEAFQCAALCIEIVRRQGHLLNSIDEAEDELSDLEYEMFGEVFETNTWEHTGEVYVDFLE